MRTPKKWLQDWLGITPIAERVAEIDITLLPVWPPHQELLGIETDITLNKVIEVKKGYEKNTNS